MPSLSPGGYALVGDLLSGVNMPWFWGVYTELAPLFYVWKIFQTRGRSPDRSG
jgi:hypothetical protein